MGSDSAVAKTVSIVTALFVTGSANTILTKVLLTTQAVGEGGEVETFKKPFFGTVNMFSAMTLVMIAYGAQKSSLWGRRGVAAAMNPDGGAPLLSPGGTKKPSLLKAFLLIAPPSFFDLLAMAMMLVGMLFIPASIWQMLRGANIIFAAILTIVILRRRLYGFHWLGVFLALLGITAVSVAALNAGAGDSDSNSSNGNMAAVGITIVLIAQVIQAAQIILEEQLLNDLDMDPLLIVGVEGVWGLLFMLCVLPVLWWLPGDDHGHAEDTYDTVLMIQGSTPVQLIVAAYMLSCATYNVAGMMVTSALSGVMRVMLEATRTLCIWLFALAWHYLVDEESPFGEEWTNWSYLQALGFLILVLGQATYGQKIHWSCLFYPDPQPPEEAHFASPGAVLAGTYSSPAPDTTRIGMFASPRSKMPFPDAGAPPASPPEFTVAGLSP